MIINSNIVLGIIILIFSAFAWTQTGELPNQSALFPKLIIIGLGITGVLMIVDTIIKRDKSGKRVENDLDRQVIVFQILIPGLILVLAYFSLILFGFYVTSFLLVITVFFYQNYRTNQQKITKRLSLKAIVFAGIVTSFMYVLFTLLLNLPTPQGSLFEIF
ncbi:tripartite tricarboxylate transporter TctB family protein [Bacillus sp. FJAT-45037]|uniref:tripartite tricarboxylate transporter TctB family protein n=1 Tax=Bacillus sp. FJAT-45037 TaxID=2011007 RepID=UPI000C24353D|nr:tripartite tricarboxylate transporter TctB family protein [Bacillus sp. FJAT-45037]